MVKSGGKWLFLAYFLAGAGIGSINLDDKGHIAIPTRYREKLQDCCDRQMVVTVVVNEQCISEQGFLWLYPRPE